MTEAAAAGLEERLRERAFEAGFSLFGVAPPDPTDHLDFYRGWVEEGRHGEMAWLAREDSVHRRSDLTATLAGVRSVVVVAHEYHQPDSADALADPARAVIAQYARGDDYHEVVKKKLLELLAWLREASPDPVDGRAYVDTGPILERDLARRAGLGWFGKNTMLINPAKGSYFFLGLLLLDRPLTPTGAFEDDRCGSCSSCLDACPTGALLGRDDSGAPVIDARRCISYLTIELRTPIPRELRSGIGNRVFGCDICQEVCPWNARFAEPASEDAYRPRKELELPGLAELADQLLRMDDAGFRERFRKSPLRRTKREGLLRNVCVGLGNLLAVSGDRTTTSIVSLLERALRDPHPLVRGHAVWALGRVSSERSESRVVRRLLADHAATESDPEVTDEIEAALAH